MTSTEKTGLCGLITTLGCIAAFGASGASNDEVTPIPVQIEVRRKADREPQIESLMEEKLEHSQKILAGLVRHDFDQIAKSAESLKLIGLSHPKGWEKQEDDDEVYEHFRMEFMRQAARLEEEARKEHLAGSAYFQQNLTATCIACHDYIRDENVKEK